MSNTFRYKTATVTESSNEAILDATTLGYAPDELYSHHVISFSELGGAKKVTKVEVMNPAGGLTEIAVDLKDNDVLVFTPYQISIVMATNARNLTLWDTTQPNRPPIMGWRSPMIVVTSDTAGGNTMKVHVRSEASANFGS